MFVGHEFLAFVLAVSLSSQVGATNAQIRSVGFLAATAAFLPDLDIGYAIITYCFAVASGVPVGWDAFWEVANGVHRTVTHSLPVGISAALIAWGGANFICYITRSRSDTQACISNIDDVNITFIQYILLLYRERSLLVASAVGGSTIIGFYMTTDMSAGAVAGIFMIITGFLGIIAFQQTALTTSQIGVATAIGTTTHPFGDIFMAAPPPLFAPITSLIGWQIEFTRFTFASNPTLNLLGVLLIEIMIIWLGVGAFARVTHRSVRTYIDRRAIIAAGYALAVFSFPPPTMVDAHRLGFTIVPLALSIGAWSGWSGLNITTRLSNRGIHASLKTIDHQYVLTTLTSDRSLRTIITTLSALTVAAVTYTAVVSFTL